MNQTKHETHPFIAYLEKLTDREQRGALAALRRGLGLPPGTAPEMFRYVVPFLPAHATQNQEAAYYLVAALFGMHPSPTTQSGNLGAHLAATRTESGGDALERRFTILLAAHPDDLPAYLRQAVSYLKSKDKPVNWTQLLKDLQAWGHPDRYVQKQWAGAFWGRKVEAPPTDLTEETDEA